MLKFKLEKRPGLLGLTTVYIEIGADGLPLDKETPFQICADAGGVRFMGIQRRMETMDDLQILAKTLDLAWRAYRMLLTQKSAVTNQAGH